MKYYKSNKQNALEDLTQGSLFMYQVSRPDGVNTNDVTRQLFGIIKHPINDDYMVAIDGDVYVHPAVAQAAQVQGNFPSQEAFINNAGESTRIRNVIKVGGRANAQDLVPNRWQEQAYDQLQADGWFDEVII